MSMKSIKIKNITLIMFAAWLIALLSYSPASANVTRAELLKASTDVANYMEEYRKHPQNVQAGTKSLSTSQFLHLISSAASDMYQNITLVTPVPCDCNGDGLFDAGDISAVVLEIFDGDGNLAADTPGGTFPGDPGCDANEDGIIDAGDISCVILVIHDGQGACGGGTPVYGTAQTGPELRKKGQGVAP